MTNTPSVTPFDYQGLTDETQEFVRSRTGKIKELADRSAKDIQDIGTMLIEVKNRIGHGRFGIWLKAEFGWSDRTARRFMAVAEYKSDTVSDLNAGLGALYLLAAPSTPKTAVDEAKKRSNAGERITKGKAKEIIESHKPRVITPPAPPITVSDPDLSWDEQYTAQINGHPDEVVFLIPGDRATMWVALGNTAAMVAEKTGTATHPLAGGLPGMPAIPIACVTITDPQTGKEDAAKVADLEELLGKKTITYVESDIHLLALLRDTTKFTIEPTKILQARQDREAEARKPFGAPIPGMSGGQPLQYPPTGWQRFGVPPAPQEPVQPAPAPAQPIQPAMPLVIDMPNGAENGDDPQEGEQPGDADMARAQALYNSTQRDNGKPDRPATPDDFEEWYINGLIQRLDEVVRFEKMAAQFARTEEQQHLRRWGSKQVEWGPELANDKFRRLAAHNTTLLDLEAKIARADTLNDVNGVLSELKHYRVGDEKLDRPVELVQVACEKKLEEYKAA